jgi:hypothetical protein
LRCAVARTPGGAAMANCSTRRARRRRRFTPLAHEAPRSYRSRSIWSAARAVALRAEPGTRPSPHATNSYGRTRAWLDCAPNFAVKSTPSAKTHRSRGPSARVGVVQLRTWPAHMPSTVRQPLARPESAVGRCWRAAQRPEASGIHCAPNGLIAFLGVSRGFLAPGEAVGGGFRAPRVRNTFSHTHAGRSNWG